jgi:hypothetical protein
MRCTRCDTLSWSVVTLVPVLTVEAHAQLQPRPTHEPIVTRLDPRFDRLVPPGTSLEKIVG